MRAFTTFFFHECTQLSAPFVCALVFLPLLGYFSGLSPVVGGEMNFMLGYAALIGIWQGFLDREFRGNAFLRHRPTRVNTAQSARSAAGLFMLLAPLLLCVLRRMARASATSGDEPRLPIFLPYFFLDSIGQALVMMALVWLIARIGLTTTGWFAPVLLIAVLLPAFAMIPVIQFFVGNDALTWAFLLCAVVVLIPWQQQRFRTEVTA